MKFNFKIQPFQTEAVESVIRVFYGQPQQKRVNSRRDIGENTDPAGQRSIQFDGETGSCYRRNAEVRLSDDELLNNIKKIQEQRNIKPSPSLVKELGAVSLDVEMETGTGKTYVYIKTMFELHKRYGWGKFIVAVPSIAIREGVKKSFEITQAHFMELYGIKARFFVYNSGNLHQLDEFSQNSGINVMIINTQAFNTTMNEEKNVVGRSGNDVARIIYTKRDAFGSLRPIDVIKANRPIIILDEPQKMGGATTQNALKNNFNPLFSLNYSATHKALHNLVYVLDALDAFQKKLVKKIEVKGFEIKNLRGTNQYVYLSEIAVAPNKPPRARLEFEVQSKSGAIKRETRWLGSDDSLYSASKGLEQYKGLSVAEVDPIGKTVTFSNGDTLTPGAASGDVNEDLIRRLQIRETIRSHFDKEEKLFARGIKCLSLFFIDEVAKYRQYDGDGEAVLSELSAFGKLGKLAKFANYGKIFEQEYIAELDERKALFSEKYQEYLNKIEVRATHCGYFSIDKQGRAVDSAVKRGSEFSDDVAAYDLILKNKERLLSFDEPTRFIFSHSALREGWDNPNVFQICTLKRSGNATAKRQEVGRGLRLCVNQSGDRQDVDVCGETGVHDVNKLTVIASESYAEFVSDLQSNIKEDLHERPTKAAISYFNGETALPEELAPLASGVHALMQGAFDPSALKDMIENGHDTKIRDNPLKDHCFTQASQGPWGRIHPRHADTVEFDSLELIKKSAAALNANLNVSPLRYNWVKGEQRGVIEKADKAGKNEFVVRETVARERDDAAESSVKYDLVGKIAKQATLTRRSVVAILQAMRPQKRRMFCQNPEEFIGRVTEEINKQKAAILP